MAQKPLNPRQLEVLGWIAEGCPGGVMTDHTHKHSAAALKSRRLVRVSRRDGWHAEPTDEGRYYLEHGEYSDARRAQPQPKPEAQKPSRPKAVPAAGKRTERRSQRRETPRVEQRQKTLAEPPAPRPEIPVPAQLRNPHPIVAALRDDKRRFNLTSLVRTRALRILQGFVTAAEQQGYRVREVRKERLMYGHRWESNDHLIVETGETSVGVRVLQQTDRSTHMPTPDEIRQQERWGTRPRKYDHTPNSLLRIELSRSWNGRQYSWSEGKRGPLEAKLPSVLEEITYRHERAKEHRRERERVEAERQQRWLEAVERAKVLARDAHRAEVLRKQASDWREAAQLREYAQAMQATAPESDEAARDWIEWALRHAQQTDPLNRVLRMPDDPEMTEELLRAFLPDRSSYRSS